ncbi:ABC transporter permease [Paenactinomyces guangxiensis]|uniref:ABC transporter permease n=1 Tax=Paenactinomyces guangxiensis TaxID=1490290 RepID=A0A7W1WRJ9_9BACL|nr:ABC transporter permease [Paenactinomyces guangxiensis]MBA4494668.1 ABC transporter permease [Paenactinomyces guangxiensis]MBH8591752.1 ABC transporter permease [Paenactinomyces guangxiensis]
MANNSSVSLDSTPVPENKEGGKRFKEIGKRLIQNRLACLGLVIIGLQIFMALFAPLLTSYDPTAQELSVKELPPGTEGHWLGTDEYGRDMWSRIIYGSRISLIVGISSVILGLVGGVVIGLLAGYYRWLDGLLMRLMDIMFSFPGILLAMLVIAMLGTSLVNVVIAISIWSIPSCARVVRGSVMSLKNQDFVTALRALGASDGRILFKHILPNCTAPIIVFATMRMATAILSTSSLSFLGLGAQPPTPEWGAMIASGKDFMWTSPHMTIIPGIAIMLVVFAFNVVGDGLRDALDPKMTEH